MKGRSPRVLNKISAVVNTGEAPQLSSTYGEYDDGANIFNNYWNFAGTSLPRGWTVPSSSNYQVDNGFIPEPSVGSTTAVYNGSIEETNSIIAEWGIDLSSTTYSSTNSYFQLNRYTPNSNMHFLGAQGSDILDNNNNNDNLITKAIASTGVQVFGVWNDGTNVDWLYNEGVLYSTTSGASVTDYLSLGWADNSQLYNFPTIYYVRTRAYPPNGVMPSVSFGSIE